MWLNKFFYNFKDTQELITSYGIYIFIPKRLFALLSLIIHEINYDKDLSKINTFFKNFISHK
ncbi:hypothetical protein BGAPBR_D0015 (plasmid) [Borreliella garinii PBr]|uniref:Uncharacterized protein n=1 Tax=Borreliella garinii PBr TaxID=498743 RepID=B8F1R3_BORGR|nr:hypothetical protein BGAPBR_D0015 [Borreliella garinii PBr]